MKIAVISLGGSLIAPDKINDDYIKKFRQTLLKFRDYKFVIVAGGGKTARTYIDALENQKVDKFRQSLIGIRITRLNAWTLINLFKENCAKVIPKSLKDVKNLLIKNKIVVCGGLRYMEDNTSDGTAASIANILKTKNLQEQLFLKMKIIIVTGSVGTGKTALAKKLANYLKYKYIDVNKVVEGHRLAIGYDRKRKSKIVDVRRLAKVLINLIIKSTHLSLLFFLYLKRFVAHNVLV